MPSDPDKQWRITIDIPMSVSHDERDRLFVAVCDAVYDWTPEDRDGWDPDVSGGPCPVAEPPHTAEPTAEVEALRSVVRQVFHNIPLDAPDGRWEEYGWSDEQAAAIRVALVREQTEDGDRG